MRNERRIKAERIDSGDDDKREKGTDKRRRGRGRIKRIKIDKKERNREMVKKNMGTKFKIKRRKWKIR